MRLKMNRIGAAVLAVAMILPLAGCANHHNDPIAAGTENEMIDVNPATPGVTANQEQTPATGEPQANETPMPTPKPSVLKIKDTSQIKAELEDAILALEQPTPMDVSAVPLSEYPDLDVKNLYYSLLSENRDYSYAYDLAVTESDGLMSVQIRYMPYVTGQFPEDFQGVPAATLSELICVAQSHLGEDAVDIRITNSSLRLDDMNRALQQAGGGYITCTLNADATAINFTPAIGFSMEECLAYLDKCDVLADQIVSSCITDNMDDITKARMLYAYLTERVKYDHRYYSDKASMPYHSQTAYGALQDNLAICGGYSHALKLLLEKSGIECFNVSGTYCGEAHMWNLARIDGTWLYFDATADRGVAEEWWKFCGVEASGLKDHHYDSKNMAALIQDAA